MSFLGSGGQAVIGSTASWLGIKNGGIDPSPAYYLAVLYPFELRYYPQQDILAQVGADTNATNTLNLIYSQLYI